QRVLFPVFQRCLQLLRSALSPTILPYFFVRRGQSLVILRARNNLVVYTRDNLFDHFSALGIRFCRCRGRLWLGGRLRLLGCRSPFGAFPRSWPRRGRGGFL